MLAGVFLENGSVSDKYVVYSISLEWTLPFLRAEI